MNYSDIAKVLSSPRVGIMLPLGFVSGLPLALTHDTLRQWLHQENISYMTMGILGLVGLPYTLKFLWAPFMDRFGPPWLGRRQGWIFISQLLLLAGIASMAAIGPYHSIWLFGMLALLVAFFSSSQDIAFDAYRTEVLHPQERGLGAGVTVTSYRVAMLTSGGLALLFADRFGFSNTYFLMALLMVVGLTATVYSPTSSYGSHTPQTILQAYTEPMKEFLSRPSAIWLLIFIVAYKIGDAFAGFFTGVFLRELGFSLTEIGVVYKAMGLGATLIGALLGGIFMVRLGLFRSLLLFGILQAISNLSFFLLAVTGKSYPLMFGAVAIENLSGGLGTAAFVAFLMSLCDLRYTATQYALLSALSAIGRELVGPPSGYLIETVGWSTFFFLTFLVALPGLTLLCFLKNKFTDFSVPH